MFRFGYLVILCTPSLVFFLVFPRCLLSRLFATPIHFTTPFMPFPMRRNIAMSY